MPLDATGYVETKPELSPEDIAINEALDRLLERLGPDGERWCSDGPGHGSFVCVVVALQHIGVGGGSVPSMALHYAAQTRGFANVPTFNDHPDTHWPDVVALIEEARR